MASQKIQELFKKADINGDGVVTRKEVLQFLIEEEDLEAVARSLGLPKPRVGSSKKAVWIFKRKFEKSFAPYDTTNNGVLQFYEFCDFLDKYKADAANARRAARIAYAQDTDG